MPEPTASTFSGCLLRGKLRRGEEVWESLPESTALAPRGEKASAATERRQLQLQLLFELQGPRPCLHPCDLPSPQVAGLCRYSPQGPNREGFVWFSRGLMPHLCPGGHLQLGRGGGHRLTVTWSQCRRCCPTSACEQDSSLLALISAPGVKGGFSSRLGVCLSKVTRSPVPLKTRPFVGSWGPHRLDSGDCTSQDHLGVHPSSQSGGLGGSPGGCPESNSGFLTPENTQHF